MSSILHLAENENLGKLVAAQRYLEKAANLFDQVFKDVGGDGEVEEVQEGFNDAIGVCELKIEHLVGKVVYLDLFEGVTK